MFEALKLRNALTVAVVLFINLGCSDLTPTPTPDLLSDWYSCEFLADLAIELSQDEYPWIIQIYRLRRTVDTSTLTECSGSSEWSDDVTRDIHVWAEERRDGDIFHGYNTDN